MDISIYSSAFNLIKNGFTLWEKSILTSCEIADEVVVAVNKSEDDTFEKIYSLNKKNLKVIKTNISYSDPLLDGKIKNEALQNCSGDILIQLDIDEYIPIEQKEIWRFFAKQLLLDNVDSYMIPNINIYENWEKYKDIGLKWYMHKKGLQRGAVNFALKEDGTIDTNKSDTCELIDINKNLCSFKQFPISIESLRSKEIPFVVHFGYLDFNSRLKRNKEFWSKHWLNESGGTPPPHKVHQTINDFEKNENFHLLEL